MCFQKIREGGGGGGGGKKGDVILGSGFDRNDTKNI